MNLPYHFPDPREEAYRRAQDFQRLSVAERLADMLDTIETGMFLLRSSPRREVIDRLYLEREAAWQGLQKELIRRHGQ
jgi:hypothetical protein